MIFIWIVSFTIESVSRILTEVLKKKKVPRIEKLVAFYCHSNLLLTFNELLQLKFHGFKCVFVRRKWTKFLAILQTSITNNVEKTWETSFGNYLFTFTALCTLTVIVLLSLRFQCLRKGNILNFIAYFFLLKVTLLVTDRQLKPLFKCSGEFFSNIWCVIIMIALLSG